MVTIWISGLLTIGTCCDIRTRKLPMALLLMGGMSGILYQCFVNGIVGITQFSGMIVGMLMIGVSTISKIGMGLGDGVLFLVLGMFYPFFHMVELLTKSSILAGVYGLLLMGCSKGNLKTELPFVPFVLLQYILLQLMNGGSW